MPKALDQLIQANNRQSIPFGKSTFWSSLPIAAARLSLDKRSDEAFEAAP